MKINKTLTSLDLRGNYYIGVEGAQALAEAVAIVEFKQNRKIKIVLDDELKQIFNDFKTKSIKYLQKNAIPFPSYSARMKVK